MQQIVVVILSFLMLLHKRNEPGVVRFPQSFHICKGGVHVVQDGLYELHASPLLHIRSVFSSIYVGAIVYRPGVVVYIIGIDGSYAAVQHHLGDRILFILRPVFQFFKVGIHGIGSDTGLLVYSIEPGFQKLAFIAFFPCLGENLVADFHHCLRVVFSVSLLDLLPELVVRLVLKRRGTETES